MRNIILKTILMGKAQPILSETQKREVSLESPTRFIESWEGASNELWSCTLILGYAWALIFGIFSHVM